MRRSLMALITAGFAAGCSGSVTGAPTPRDVLIDVSPNPLPFTATDEIEWNLRLEEHAGVRRRLDRWEVVATDAAGITVGRADHFISRSAGCSICPGDVFLEPRRTLRFSGLRLHLFGPAPVSLRLRLFYTDDRHTATGTETIRVVK